MKFLIVIATCLFASSLPTLAFATSQEAGKANSSTDKKRPASAEDRLINAVNRYRARFRLPPLKSDPVLMRLARQRAPFVDARRGAGTPGYNHQACGRWCRQHAREVGFTGPATDNLAMGYETPEGAVGGWANEDDDDAPAGHNFQMRGLASINGKWVDEGYNRIGVGIIGRNYIAIFGRSPADETN
jgi:uncharacterized protein YkwD